MATRYWKRKLFLAKIDATYGTDPVPVVGTDWMQIHDVTLSTMEGEDVERGIEYASMGAQPILVAGLYRKITFKVELQGSGTAGTPPKYGALLRACGLAQTIVAVTSVTYNPVSTGLESATGYMNVDGTLFKLRGMRGKSKLVYEAGKPPMIEFEFLGLYDTPTDVALVQPTMTGYPAPLILNPANVPVYTLGAYTPQVRMLSLDMGQSVEFRQLITGASVILTDRAETVEMAMDADDLANFNPFALAEAGTSVALTARVGATAGKIATLSVPILQLMRTQSLQQNQNIVEWPLRGVPLRNAGNDQFTLAFT